MTQCYICSQELLSLDIDSRDNKLKPCHVCQAVIQSNIEALENRAKRKEQMRLWKNEMTGEYSLDELDDIEELEDDSSEYLIGLHFDQEHEEDE